MRLDRQELHGCRAEFREAIFVALNASQRFQLLDRSARLPDRNGCQCPRKAGLAAAVSRRIVVDECVGPSGIQQLISNLCRCC
ncbi:hypothetical protein MESS4_50037 [Mesorhizobium sp. STM 4661]|nr:hypothetical protein MESS4_50037 [Mesorhizobium sp. STM 4661]